MSDGKLLQSRGANAANVLSPKELCVRPTTFVRVSAERNNEPLSGIICLLRNWWSCTAFTNIIIVILRCIFL